jgi:hypothetical protein
VPEAAANKDDLPHTVTGNFTISMRLSIDHNAYAGEILHIGNLTYGLNGETLKPYLTQGTTTYNSTNLLGTSDVWKSQNRGTGGQWYTPTRLGYFILTLTYTNGVLTVYRDGLIDQRVELTLSGGAVSIGSFAGRVSSLRIWNTAFSQDQAKALVAEAGNLAAEQEFEDLSLPAEVYTDLVFPPTTPSGAALTWASSRTAVLSNTGILIQPHSDIPVTITVKMGTRTKTIDVVVKPRNISQNKIIAYQFAPEDRYITGGVSYVLDHSPYHHNAQIQGNATIDGTLNLTANTNAAFSTNGYLTLPHGILDNLRSYTVLVQVKPSRLDKLPRVWDFGSGSGNSVFGRADALTAGLKYNGGTTVLINSSTPLTAGAETQLAFTFDARIKTTKIYVNGTQTASATTITQEPYQLSLIAPDTRNFIGRSQWENADNVDFCGLMDNFFLYNTALTAAEIKAIQNNPTHIEMASETPAIVIYPNPIRKGEEAFITTSAKNIEILNLSGQRIAAHHSPNGGTSLGSFNHAGLYLVRATDTNLHTSLSKLIVLD